MTNILSTDINSTIFIESVTVVKPFWGRVIPFKIHSIIVFSNQMCEKLHSRSHKGSIRYVQ